MGYHTTLYLIDVKIKDESLPSVKKALKSKRGRGQGPLKYFLEQAALPDDGFLCFTLSGSYTSSYVPDEDDGTVPALEGKWRNCEEIAEWLKLHSEKGGRLVQHSCEGDGAAWGWEFDGKGRLRDLALCSVGKWR